MLTNKNNWLNEKDCNGPSGGKNLPQRLNPQQRAPTNEERARIGRISGGKQSPKQGYI